MREFSFNGLYKFFSRLTTGFIDKAKLTEHTFMIVIAIIIGILSGFAAIGIRAMIKAISYLSFPGNGNILQNILSNPWYVILLAPILGGLVVGPIIYFFAKEAKGHGVPEVMQAILLQGVGSGRGLLL